MSDNIEHIQNLLEEGWQIRDARTGRHFPPNNRLVQLQKEDKLREYYLSEEDFETLKDRNAEMGRIGSPGS